MRRTLLILFALGCLAGAGVQASRIDSGSLAASGCVAQVDPTLVEKSFSEELAAMERGEANAALLSLRKRAEKGPHPGAARYLLGGLAYEEEAFAAAVDHYRAAVEADPALTDPHGPFEAKETILQHMDELRAGPWADKGRAELTDVHFLQRRLAGGCE